MPDVGRKTVQHPEWNIGQNGFRSTINVLRKLCPSGYRRFGNRNKCCPDLVNKMLNGNMKKRNETVEAQFVRSFVRSERRERAIFELALPKQRGAFLGKLCHRFSEVLDERFMKVILVPNSCSDDIYKLLKAEGAPKTSYVISSYEDVDMQDIPLSDALEQTIGRGLPSIVICFPGHLAYFEAEQEAGPPPRYILKRAAR